MRLKAIELVSLDSFLSSRPEEIGISIKDTKSGLFKQSVIASSYCVLAIHHRDIHTSPRLRRSCCSPV